MKKTFNINVAGYPFVIDDDAYNLLNDYLDTIEHAFASYEDSGELISDLESRIAEILLDYNSMGSPIINLQQVEELIARVGKPEDILDVEDASTYSGERFSGQTTDNTADTDSEKVTPPPYVPPVRKKLFRDTQNAMLGGVCSGLGLYLNIDATLIRLITVVLTIASVATCGLAYLVLWIVIPEARTPLQKMQMMGERPTMENIGKTVTDSFKEEKGEKSGASADGGAPRSTISTIFSILLKALIMIGIIIGVPILIAMVIGLIGCVFFITMAGSSFMAGLDFLSDEDLHYAFYGCIIGIGALLALGVPIFILLYKAFTKGKKPFSSATRWILGILCAGGFVTAAISTGILLGHAINGDFSSNDSWPQSMEKRMIELNNYDKDEPVEGYDYEANGWEVVTEESPAQNPVPADSIKTDSIK